MSGHSSVASSAIAKPPVTDFFSTPMPISTEYRPQFETYDNSKEIFFTEAVSGVHKAGAQTTAANGQSISMNVCIPAQYRSVFEARRMMLKKVTLKTVCHAGFSHPFYVNLHAANKNSKDCDAKWTPLAKVNPPPNAPAGLPTIYGFDCKHGLKLHYGDQKILAKHRAGFPDEEHLDMIYNTCSGTDAPGRTLWQLPNSFDKGLLDTLDGLFSKHAADLNDCLNFAQKDKLEKMQAPMQSGTQEMTVIPKDTLLGTILDGFLDSGINSRVYGAIDPWCFTLLDRSEHVYEDFSADRRAVSDTLLMALIRMRLTMCRLLPQFMGFMYGVDLVLTPPVYDDITFKDVAASSTVPKISTHLVTLHFVDLGPKPRING